MLSAETIARLRDALVDQWRSARLESEETHAAIVALAREARERRVYPEALIVMIKAIEMEVLRGEVAGTPLARRHLREWLVTSCLRAYYESEAT